MATNLDASQFVKSKYIKGSDLNTRRPTRVTIQDVDQQEFPEQGQKLILKFLETDQQLILNKTQTTTLIELFGPQTGTWRGKRVNLMQVSSSYQGRPTILITEAESAAAAPEENEDNPF
jgi:DNA/RNA endonuclease YhcR with UshA esterase domain